MKEIIATPDAPRAIGPYSQAVRVAAGGMLFCSGQIPSIGDGQIMEGPAGAGAAVMEN